MEIELRPWQEDAYAHFKQNGHRGIVAVATGKGKTVFGIHCILKLSEENNALRTCIIVPTINLMFQWRDKIIEFLGISESDIGLYYGKKRENEGKKIVIFVINSFVKNLALIKISTPFDFMIADECHHYGSNLFSNLFKYETKYSLGLSATPIRESDPKGTEIIFKSIGDITYSLSHLEDPNSVPPFNIWSILVNLTLDEVSRYEKITQKCIPIERRLKDAYNIDKGTKDYMVRLNCLASARSAKARRTARGLLSNYGRKSNIKYTADAKAPLVQEIIRMERGSKIIVFTERRKLSEKILKDLPLSSNAMSVDNKTKNLNYKLDQFKNLDKGVIIAPKILDEGQDFTDASVAIVASFTSSVRQMIQRDGRILRKTPEKLRATRYTLVVKGLEERKYFDILDSTSMAETALNGVWVEFDGKNFTDAPDFKKKFREYLDPAVALENLSEKVKIKLNDYEYNYHKPKDPDFCDRRIKDLGNPYYKKIIEADQGQSWPRLYRGIISNQLDTSYIKKIRSLSPEEKELLNNQYRETMRIARDRKVQCESIWPIISACIHGHTVKLDKNTKDFFIKFFTGGVMPSFWKPDLYKFAKEDILDYIKDMEPNI